MWSVAGREWWKPEARKCKRRHAGVSERLELCNPSFHYSLHATHHVSKETPTMQHVLHSKCVLFSIPRGVNTVIYFTNKMVEQLIKVTSEYEERLLSCEYVLRFWYGRRMLRDDGGPNRFFLMYIFFEQSVTILFLKDIRLLRSKMHCIAYGGDMTWLAYSTHSECFRWRCQRRVAGVSCNQSASLKVGSWFQQSKLTRQE